MFMGRMLLDQIKIASPCPASWRSMQGDDKKRFCQLCQLNVYNIAGMTLEEAEAFLRQAEGRVCIRIYQRADGKVLTRNCPVGVAAVRRRLGFAAALIFVFAFGMFSMALGRMKREYADDDRPTYGGNFQQCARSWPVIGPVIDYFDPPVYAGAMVLPVSSFSSSPKSQP